MNISILSFGFSLIAMFSFSQNENTPTTFMKGLLGFSNYFPTYLAYSAGIESRYFAVSVGVLYDLGPATYKSRLLPQEVNENPWGFQGGVAGPEFLLSGEKAKLRPVIDFKFKHKVFQEIYQNQIYRMAEGNLETITGGFILEWKLNKNLTLELSPGAGVGLFQAKNDNAQHGDFSGAEFNFCFESGLKWVFWEKKAKK